MLVYGPWARAQLLAVSSAPALLALVLISLVSAVCKLQLLLLLIHSKDASQSLLLHLSLCPLYLLSNPFGFWLWSLPLALALFV